MMYPLKVIIADDEALIRERISSLLSPYDDINVISECHNGQNTIKAIQSHAPDILFLDIKMPNFGGFEVLEQVQLDNTLLIFITAYDQYALKAFDYAAFDYIVKPIDSKRFDKTMARVLAFYKNPTNGRASIINVRDNGVIFKLEIQKITHLEAADNYVYFHTNERSYKKRSTLTSIVKSLSTHPIVRVHRSYAVNSDQIESMAHIYKGDYLIKMKNGKIIPTSKSYSEQVRELLA